MHRYPDLERLANARRFHAGANTSPECRVEQDHIHRGVQNVRRQLFEIDDHGIGGERNPNHLPSPPHPVQSVHRIFEIVVANVLDGLSEADGLFCGPDPVRIEPERISWQRRRQCTISFELVIRMKNPRLQLMRGEAEALFQGERIRDQLVDGANFTGAGARIGISEKTVRSEGDPVAQTAAQNIRNGHAPRLAQDVEAGELECRENLRAVVVQRRRRVGDQKSHFFNTRRIVPDEI